MQYETKEANDAAKHMRALGFEDDELKVLFPKDKDIIAAFKHAKSPVVIKSDEEVMTDSFKLEDDCDAQIIEEQKKAEHSTKDVSFDDLLNGLSSLSSDEEPNEDESKDS